MTSNEIDEMVSADEGNEEMSADEIDGTFQARPRPNVVGVELDGEIVLLAEGTAKTHWLSQTAAVVWKCLDGQVDLDELGDEIAEAFGADPATVRGDVLNVVMDMGRAGLLEGVAESAPAMPVYEPPEGLPLGEDIPTFGGATLTGDRIDFEDFRGRPVLLVNWSPHCGYCRRIAPDLAEVQPQLRSRGVELLLVALGDAEENRSLLDESGLDSAVLLADETPEMFFGIGTPAAYIIDEDGKVASKLALGANDVPVLAKSAAGQDE